MAPLTKSDIKNRLDQLIIEILDPLAPLDKTVLKLMKLSTDIHMEVHGESQADTVGQ